MSPEIITIIASIVIALLASLPSWFLLRLNQKNIEVDSDMKSAELSRVLTDNLIKTAEYFEKQFEKCKVREEKYMQKEKDCLERLKLCEEGN